MGPYLRSSIPDFLLCTLMSASLSSAVCSGFHMKSPNSDSVLLLFLLAFFVSVLMTVFSWKRSFTVAGIVTGIVLAVGSVIYIQAVHLLTDEESNSAFIFLMISILTGILVFLLSRSRPGMAVLFSAGSFICAGADFLQFGNSLWSLVIFIFGALGMYLYRVYMLSLRNADLGEEHRKGYCRQILVFCLVSMVLSSGIFFWIVRPLDPPVQDLKLIRVMRQMDLLEVLGVFHTSTVMNPFLDSGKAPDSREFSQEEGNEASEDIENADDEKQDDSLTRSTLQEKADSVAYAFAEKHMGWILAVIILLAVCAAFCFAAGKRRRWYRAVQALNREDAALNFFDLFMRDMEKAGIRKPEYHTLQEFCTNACHELQAFDAEGIGFRELSEICERIVYGAEKISHEDYEKFEKYYGVFYSNLKKRMTFPKYMLKWILL